MSKKKKQKKSKYTPSQKFALALALLEVIDSLLDMLEKLIE